MGASPPNTWSGYRAGRPRPYSTTSGYLENVNIAVMNIAVLEVPLRYVSLNLRTRRVQVNDRQVMNCVT